MEANTGFMEPLLEKATQYGKTSYELMKMQSLHKTAALASTLISRFILAIVFSFFALILSIGIALWLGGWMGKTYYGFFVVAAFYGLAVVILFLIFPFIKARVNNSIIAQMFN